MKLQIFPANKNDKRENFQEINLLKTIENTSIFKVKILTSFYDQILENRQLNLTFIVIFAD